MLGARTLGTVPAMRTETLWSIAAVTVGFLAGPTAGAFMAHRIPEVGWFALLTIFFVCALAPPLVLIFQAAGGQYTAMVRTWSLFFFFALFVAAVGASAFAVSAATAAVEPASLVFLAAGLGLLISLGTIKLMLLKKSAKKDVSADAD
jgi:hypothetical protein